TSSATPDEDRTQPTSSATPEEDGTQPTSSATPGEDGTQPTGSATPGEDGTQPTGSATPGEDGTQPTGSATPGEDGTQPTGSATPSEDSTQPTGSATPEEAEQDTGDREADDQQQKQDSEQDQQTDAADNAIDVYAAQATIKSISWGADNHLIQGSNIISLPHITTANHPFDFSIDVSAGGIVGEGGDSSTSTATTDALDQSLAYLKDTVNSSIHAVQVEFSNGYKLSVPLDKPLWDYVTGKEMLYNNIKNAVAASDTRQTSVSMGVSGDGLLQLIKTAIEGLDIPSGTTGKQVREIKNSVDELTLTDEQCRVTINIGSKRNQFDASPYIVDTVHPDNVTINLFDYTLYDWYLSDSMEDDPKAQLVVQGINGVQGSSNQSHGLLFRKSNGVGGTWNQWTGNVGGVTQGLVKNTLGSDGYPVLNLSETFPREANGNYVVSGTVVSTYDPQESLAYLFDPNDQSAGQYRKVYRDVEGLFTINEAGNYYYNSRQNFAEFDASTGSNRFTLYNAPAVEHGQFFPFNTAGEVFKLSNGALVNEGLSSAGSAVVNHYLGLTMEVEFQQPLGGMVSVGHDESHAKPMVYEFSGDDDVWVFIDDVLVADLGGIHDEMKVLIDFSTGEITIERASDPNQNTTITTTIRERFELAGRQNPDMFEGDTLAGNTTHTLKMFYMERGNVDSNLTLSFNLMEPVDNVLVKLDQNGNPVEGASFALYRAELDADGNPIREQSNLVERYKVQSVPISTNLTTNHKGEVVLPSEVDYSAHPYYILRETNIPAGYFSTGDVLLEYDKFQYNKDGTSTGTNLLLGDNRWQTGAYMSFAASVYQAGELNYSTNQPISSERAQSGLVVVVPMMKISTDSSGQWVPLYGSGLAGYHEVDFNATDSTSALTQRQAVLTALLYQIYGSQHAKNDVYRYSAWTLDWSENNSRFQATLTDLPGDAQRYYWANNDVTESDLAASYYFLDLENLQAIFGDLYTKTKDQKLQGIADMIQQAAQQHTAGVEWSQLSEKQVWEAVAKGVADLLEQLEQQDEQAFGLLDVSEFNRIFSSRIYIPNAAPSLTVQKLDQDGNPLAGAQFSLYATQADANGNTNPLGTVVTGSDGTAYFHFGVAATPSASTASVLVQLTGDYLDLYLRETKAPTEEYIINDKVIPVRILQNGRIYADGLKVNDGITVRKGLGELVQTMARYAVPDSVNVTLRDITAGELNAATLDALLKGTVVDASAGQQGDDSILRTGRTLNLHYGLDNALLQYGTHPDPSTGVAPEPYFEADEGVLALEIQQNYLAHANEAVYTSVAAKQDLRDQDIRGLFTGSTTVVVRNRHENSRGNFFIHKTLAFSSAVSEDEQQQYQASYFGFDVKVDVAAAAQDNQWATDGAVYTIRDSSNNVVEQGTVTFKEITQGSNLYNIASVTMGTPAAGSSRIYTDGSSYLIWLKNGETVVVEGVPFRANITAQEVSAAADYTAQDAAVQGLAAYKTSVQVNAQGVVSGTTATGTVEEILNNPQFYFYNYVDKTSSITLEKKLAQGETSTLKFPFEVTLFQPGGGSLLTGNYQYTVHYADGTNNLEGTVTSGKLSVALGHEDKVTIEGLPVGAQYMVEETPMGYRPEGTIDGQSVTLSNNSLTGTVLAQPAQGAAVNQVVFTNTRSASITITKRNGQNELLSGAGFTLYDKDTGAVVRSERYTDLAMRTEIDVSDNAFDQDAMRYTASDGKTYIVHTVDAGGTPKYYYYRWLTDKEKQEFNSNKWTEEQNSKVEAIVEFTELPLTGDYIIRETTVPKGYVQPGEIQVGSLPKETADGSDVWVYDVLYTVTNHEEIKFPVTGLMGIGGLLAAGVTLVGAALVLAISNKRRKSVPGESSQS
ncbi:SpaA isopeptide-forming pilin-related protein, partial [uncultured Allofournierella sp.]|uniref:SpaA isopeptide-forming pilin-related protein n=1 Tax=uncultured Allofournierella sp. TaxID=1940258 RepID=UPI003752CA23